MSFVPKTKICVIKDFYAYYSSINLQFILMKFIALLLLVAIGFCTSDLYDYPAYCRKFHKSYSEEEYEERKLYFQENVQKIIKINQRQEKFKLGWTVFTDYNYQQLSDRFHAMVDDKGPFQIPPQHNLQVGVPVSLDWRDEGMISSVKDQGTCGSCWVFLTIAMYQSFLMLHGEPQYDLSEEYILECTTDYHNNGYQSSCAGGYVDFSIPFVHQTGAPLESDYPYIADSYGSGSGYPNTPGICNSTSNIMINQTNTTFNKYQDLTDDQLKDVVAYSPVGALMYVESGIYSYTEGVYSGCPAYNDSIANINHAVVIVGYTEDGHWIIKNSWGTSWGEEGYAIIDKDYDCGLKYRVYELRGTNDQLFGYFLFVSLWAVLFLTLML